MTSATKCSYYVSRSLTEAEAENVPGMSHSSMPGVSCIELAGRRDVEKQVTQRCLQGVEREVEHIKREDGDADSSVCDLGGKFV